MQSIHRLGGGGPIASGSPPSTSPSTTTGLPVDSAPGSDGRSLRAFTSGPSGALDHGQDLVSRRLVITHNAAWSQSHAGHVNATGTCEARDREVAGVPRDLSALFRAEIEDAHARTVHERVGPDGG